MSRCRWHCGSQVRNPCLERLSKPLTRRGRTNDNVIQDKQQMRIGESIDETEINDKWRVHYLPYHRIIDHNEKTSRLRAVYNASSESSFVDGPVFFPEHIWHSNKDQSFMVAMIGDNEKSFLMVSITESDRIMLRFVRLDDIFKEKPKVIVLRFWSFVKLLNHSTPHQPVHHNRPSIRREISRKHLRWLPYRRVWMSMTPTTST